MINQIYVIIKSSTGAIQSDAFVNWQTAADYCGELNIKAGKCDEYCLTCLEVQD